MWSNPQNGHGEEVAHKQTKLSHPPLRDTFCGDVQLGVSSVRQHLEEAISKLEKFNKQKMALASQASKVKQALAYEGSSDAGKKVKEQEGEVADLKAKLQKLEQQEAAGQQSRQAQEADLEQKVGCTLLSPYIYTARVLLLLFSQDFYLVYHQRVYEDRRV